ncbi:hypothetical protein INR49_023751 [Caranx melampygus]|nr:hypothetical protein INR49_023751 [Caranx melampygus]
MSRRWVIKERRRRTMTEKIAKKMDVSLQAQTRPLSTLSAFSYIPPRRQEPKEMSYFNRESKTVKRLLRAKSSFHLRCESNPRWSVEGLPRCTSALLYLTALRETVDPLHCWLLLRSMTIHFYGHFYPSGLHPTGHIYTIPPDVVLRFLGPNDSCDHWAVRAVN